MHTRDRIAGKFGGESVWWQIYAFGGNIDNKRLILDWKLLSATVTIRVSHPQQDSDGRLQK